MVRAIFYILTILLLSGCGKRKALDKSDYIKYVENEDNELTKVKTKGDLKYSLTLCPLDYMIAKEFRVNEIGDETFSKRKSDLDGYHYFKLRMSLKEKNKEVILFNANGEQDIKERYEYLSYGFEENIYLLRNARKDTIPVAMYHFERTYGVVPYLDVIFSFKADDASEKTDKNLEVFIYDNIFGSGILTYEFEREKINETPTLKLY